MTFVIEQCVEQLCTTQLPCDWEHAGADSGALARLTGMAVGFDLGEDRAASFPRHGEASGGCLQPRLQVLLLPFQDEAISW